MGLSGLSFVIDARPLRSVSFGQPRTGDAIFAQYAARALQNATLQYRVVHNRDPVPHVPARSTYGYQHLVRRRAHVSLAPTTRCLISLRSRQRCFTTKA